MPSADDNLKKFYRDYIAVREGAVDRTITKFKDSPATRSYSNMEKAKAVLRHYRKEATERYGVKTKAHPQDMLGTEKLERAMEQVRKNPTTIDFSKAEIKIFRRVVTQGA